MNVLLVVDRWLPQKGGLERYAAALADSLVGTHDRVRVVTLERAPGPQSLGIEFAVVDAGPGSRLHRERAFAREADAACRDPWCDVSITFRHPGPAAGVFFAMGGLYASALAARRGGLSSLVPWVRAKERFFLEREREALLADRPPLVLAPSSAVAEDVRRRFPRAFPRCVVTHLAVDHDRFHPASAVDRAGVRRRMLGVLETTPLLLFVGNDAWRKGLDRARAVLAAVRAELDPNALLICAGRGVRKTDRDRGVVALGECDPAPLYRTVDALLSFSREDSFGMHVAEALASGTPVLASAETGAAELIRDPLVGEVGPGDRPAGEWLPALARLLAAREDGVAARRAAAAGLHAPLHFARVRALLEAEAQSRGGLRAAMRQP